MDTEIENRIEELIDQKLDESEGEVDREELKLEILEELRQDKGVEIDTPLSRRSFLKTLGLGAGGLAFSSLAASANWALWQPQRLGKSDINADALDGSSLGDLAGNQLSASGGSLDVNEGSGSGLNADTVDGKDASDLGGSGTGFIWRGTALTNSRGQYNSGSDVLYATTQPLGTGTKIFRAYGGAFANTPYGNIYYTATVYLYEDGSLKAKNTGKSGVKATGTVKYSPNKTVTGKVHANSGTDVTLNITLTRAY